jgi:dolichyl-diphosphooligosaccharide--protein glycosyltransferase
MATAEADIPGVKFFFEGQSGRNTRGLLRLLILCTIAAAAVASRLFSVIRFESIIHECMANHLKLIMQGQANIS